MSLYENLDEMCQYYSQFFNVQMELEDIGENIEYIDKEVDKSIGRIEHIIKAIRIEENKIKPLEIINDYYIKYDGEGVLFDLHKPSDIRSLIRLINDDLMKEGLF